MGKGGVSLACQFSGAEVAVAALEIVGDAFVQQGPGGSGTGYISD